MVMTKCEDVTHKVSVNYSSPEENSFFGEVSLIQFQSHCHPRGWGGGGCLFEAGRLLTFSAFSMSAYSRWVLIRGWALIRINTIYANGFGLTNSL